MFRRSKTEPLESLPLTHEEPGSQKKGRPTPTRREAEAAARERAKVPRTRKEQMAKQRAMKSESSATVRAEMKAGNEKYLLPRDKGPVRRFIRDFVDTRFSLAEVAIPLMILSLIISSLVIVLFPLLIADLLFMRYRLRKQLAIRFPNEPLKGTTYYAVTRSMQLKFLRMPKPKMKIGDPLPETYR